MINSSLTREMIAREKKELLIKSFFKKGLLIAIFSGMSYGLYSAFITLAMSSGIWNTWSLTLSTFVVVYVLGATAAALNDTISALWAWAIAIHKGKAGDFFKCVFSKPGIMMVLAAIMGGPIAGTAYVIALQTGGTIVIPVTALCPAISSILAKVFFKQKLNARMSFGILICVFSSILIGISGGTDDVGSGVVIGLIFALVAAIGWGLEGVIAGYGTALIDYEIGIMIRQTTSGLVNLFILVPILSTLAGSPTIGFNLILQALTDSGSIFFFILSGFLSLIAFSLWYKGNSMCGVALGMACNGTYAFWGPFFGWILLGLMYKVPNQEIPLIVWISAIIMTLGIFIIAANPLSFLKKGEYK